jgi:hypothetical protein
MLLFDLMNSKLLVGSFFFICLLSGPAAGADNANPADNAKADSPLLRKAIFGLGLHDTGPISDKQENGVDPNWELQVNPPQWKWWRWVGSPYTIVGVMANFTGATTQFYAAINYEVSLSNKYTDAWTFNLTKTLFVSVALGPAIHNGPLKKNEEHCKQTDDCGFGYRVVPRLFGEIGTYFLKNQGISFFVDHMSGAAAFGAPQNEGVDHVGIRYHYVFKTD